MALAVADSSHHETSLWPMVVGLGVLLSVIGLLAHFVWLTPLLAMVLGGMGQVALALGFAGWAKEFFRQGTEEGLGTIAVTAFIVSEVLVFGTVFVAFWVARISHASVWTSFIPIGLDWVFAVWLTIILWASSLTMVLAQRSFVNGNRGHTFLWLGTTVVLGGLFTVLHINEWIHLADSGFRLRTNIFSSTFYGLTGVHTAHVIVGLAIQLLILLALGMGWMRKLGVTLFRGASFYWHFVDLMWLLVAANAYLIGGSG